MAGPKNIRPEGLPQKPQLQQVEAEQAKQKQQGKVTPEDAARLAQRAGFARKKSKKGIDIGDSSDATVPLPEDDVDAEAWSPEALDGAKQNLALAGAQFREIAEGAEGIEETMGASVVASSFLPTEDGVQKLQELADRPKPEPIGLDEMSNSVATMFDLEIEEVPDGHKILAAGMVVAGEKEALEVEDGGLNEQKLAEGIQKVAKKSSQSVDQARTLSKGIEEKRNFNRTHIKR